MSEMFGNPIKVIIEIERHSNKKWEYDREKDELFLDRTLKYPYFYPYAYGFIPNTLGNDGDELDILMITDQRYLNYSECKKWIECYIVGGLMMRDENGPDEKIFVVPVDEINTYVSKSGLELQLMQDNIKWFFTNYKLSEEDRWSRVEQFVDKDDAMLIYKESVYNLRHK